VAYPPGTVFAGFTLDRVLGAGGMGTVYLARHPRLPRWDALKLLSPELSHDPEFRKRFEQEADLTASLDHRNIVLVHDRGCELDQLWIDMQYIQGIDCNQALERYGPMPFEYALRIVTEVGKGLDHAHRLGLLHRDVKPANIMLAPTGDPEEAERVLLTDFGVAKAVDARHRLTSTGNLIATLAYAAPEQIQSRPLDHRVDIYALGCVLYELLTGVVPFPENSHYDTMHAHLMKPPPRPSQLVPSLPRVFDDIVATAMAKDRDRRFDNCRELANTARAALRPAPTPAALKSNRPPAVRRPKRPARPTSARPAAPGRGRRAIARGVTSLVVAATGAVAVVLPADSHLSVAGGALDLPRSTALPAEALVAVLEVGGNVDLYLVDTATGEALRRLTDSPDADRGPSLSPDRQSIIYVRENGGVRRLRVMAANGAGDRDLFPQPLENCPNVSRPAWSMTDASTLAVVCFGETQRSLRVIGSSGEVVRTLDAGAGFPFEPTFSPDGATIAFWSGDSADATAGAIYTVAADGTGAPIRLSASAASGDTAPTYSPDGREIAFRRRVDDGTIGGNGEVYVMNADGSDVRAMAPHVAQDAAPAWSTDGSRIAFMSQRLGVSSVQANYLWVMDADGQDAQQVLTQESSGVGYAPAWGPR